MDILSIVNTVLLGLVLVVAVITLFGIVGEKESHENKKNSDESQKQLEDVKAKAQEIMESAMVKAKLIIDDTKAFKEGLEKESSQNLTQTYETFIAQLNQHSTEIVNSYQNFFDSVQEDLKSKETNLLSEIEMTSQNRVSSIDQELKDEIQNLRIDMKDNFAKEMEQARQVVEDYKNSKMADIDARIEEQITRLSKQIFAEIIPVEKQKELIFNALENAKKEGVFEI